MKPFTLWAIISTAAFVGTLTASLAKDFLQLWMLTYGLKEVITSFTPPRPGFPSRPQVWVPGKSLSECLGPNGELNDFTAKCRTGYYQVK